MNITRAETIARIESIGVGVSHSIQGGVEVMRCVMDQHDEIGYCWSLGRYYTNPIAFSRPPASERAEEVIKWADLTLSFIQAAITCTSPAHLQRIAPTSSGLRYFLTGKLEGTTKKIIQGIGWYVDLRTNQCVCQTSVQQRSETESSHQWYNDRIKISLAVATVQDHIVDSDDTVSVVRN